MDTRIRAALVIVFAAVLTVGPPAPRAAAFAEGPGRESLGGGGQTSIDSAGTATGGPSVVTWGSRQKVGANYTWSYGSHLATTSSATRTYLHDVATTDRVNGTWADNNGPYLGVNYVRGNASGTSWASPFRVNAKSQHGDGAAIAASGKYVYVAWFRRTKFINYDPDAPRTLYFRRNTSHGATASWGARQALTSTSGRVGIPTMAAAGAFVYIAYTDSGNGNIRLAISDDRGATWTKKTIGSTSGTTDEGFEGVPSVAAAGSNVVVSWLADDDPSVVARVSIDGGVTWDLPTTLAPTATHVPASAARNSRLGVAWPTDDGGRFSLWTAGTWGDVQTVAPPAGSGRTYLDHYSPALAFGDAGQVGVAWGACWNHCETFDELTNVDLVWAESKDDGTTWFAAQVLGSGGGSTWRINDAPSVLWPTANKRIVAWNGYRLAHPYYRMFLRIGSGTN